MIGEVTSDHQYVIKNNKQVSSCHGELFSLDRMSEFGVLTTDTSFCISNQKKIEIGVKIGIKLPFLSLVAVPSSWKSYNAEFSVDVRQKCGVITWSLNVDLRATGNLWGKLCQGSIPHALTCQLHGCALSERGRRKEWWASTVPQGEDLGSSRSADYMGIGEEGGT